MKKVIFLIVFCLGAMMANQSNAQCDTIVSLCNQHMDGYISDGQSYVALLIDDEVAEFHTTLFGGSTYRIAACSGLTDGNLIFTVMDSERNLLYTNEEFDNAAFWDFQVNGTVDCIIEARLNPDKVSSGCAVMLIGFKQ